METQNATPLFSERNSVDVEKDAQRLFSPAEIQLGPEELEEARRFAGGLFEGKLDERIQVTVDKNIEEINQISSKDSIVKYHLDYFKTEAGQVDLAKLGISQNDENELGIFLSDTSLVNSDNDFNVRRKAGSNSANWYKAQLQNLLNEDSSNDSNFDDLPALVVNYQPDVLIGKIEALQAYRSFYRDVKRSMKKPDDDKSNLDQAKAVLLDIHRARINNLMANIYADAIDLTKQLAVSGDDRNSQLGKFIPVIQRAVLRDRKPTEEVQPPDLKDYENDFARRLDYLRQGVGEIDGKISPITPALKELIESLSTEDRPTLKPVLAPEIIEKLKEMPGNCEMLVDVLKSAFASWNLLSVEQATEDEVKNRTGYATDSKWQIVTRAKKGAAETEGTKRVIWVSEEIDKSLIDSLATAVHESTHAWQKEFNEKLAAQIPLAKIMGRRNLTLREGGSIDQESRFKAKFGIYRPTNPHYFRALEAKLNGANKLQAIRVFYNSHIAEKQKTKPNLGDDDYRRSRAAAVGSALRLWRFGEFDSQPLDYAEQELAMRALRQQPEGRAEAISIAGSSFSIKEAAQLHQAGLLDLPEELSVHPSDDIFNLFEQKYLRELLA